MEKIFKKTNVIKLFIKENISSFLILFLLLIISIINQLSMGDSYKYFWKNLIWHTAGVILFIIIVFFTDYRKITFKMIFYIYVFLNLVLLIMAMFKIRWIRLGIINIEPSEFVKPVLLLLISLMAEEYSESILPSKVFFKLLFLIFIPIILILRVDLDHAFIIGIVFLSFLLFLGISRKLLIFLIFSGLIVGCLVFPYMWDKLAPYQKWRIIGYLYPEKYAQTWGYQLNQSLIAIGSGGLFGQGFKKGWTTRLHYLPAKRTDLAFSVWAETWGFIGVSLLLFLYGYLLWYAIRISSTVKDWLGRYLSTGICLILLGQIIFNIGGAIGILPMTSIPLPFLSYGGSITISVYFLLSLLFNIAFKGYFFK